MALVRWLRVVRDSPSQCRTKPSRAISQDLLVRHSRELWSRAKPVVAQSDINPSNAADKLPPGTVFLNRRVSSDWTHTGFVVEARGETFATIEGNTNDEGSREGYEVCARTRGYAKKDFVRLSS